MDNKYLKYKKKYLGLKNIGGSGGIPPLQNGTQVIFDQTGKTSEQRFQLDKTDILLSLLLILDKMFLSKI